MSGVTQIDVGKVKFTWKGEYSSSVDYERDDVVRFTNGKTYVAVLRNGPNQDTGVNAPTADGSDTSYWELFTDGGDPAAILTAPGSILQRGTPFQGVTSLLPGAEGQQLRVSYDRFYDDDTDSWNLDPYRTLEWADPLSTWSLYRHEQISYTGGQVAAGTSRAWIPGVFVDYTPTYTNSKIFFHAQFAHSDSGTGSITIAHMYEGTTLRYSVNLSGHSYYVGNWNNMSYWFDSWGTEEKRIGVQGSKYSSSYNIIWHASSWTAVDESPSQTNQALVRPAQVVVQEWVPQAPSEGW